MIYIQFIVILTCVIRCSGFLFDENTTPLNGGGSSLSDKHYLTVIDMIQEEKKARHQMEYYMTQLKDKIVENQNRTQSLEAKLGQFSPKNDTIKEGNEIQLLKNVTDFLLQEYRSLDTNYKQLQQKYLEVLQENNQLVQGWNSTAQQLILIEQKLVELKSFQAINQLQDVQNLQNENLLLQQKLQMTNNRIDSITSTQQARGQDLLALYNKALEMENDLLQLAMQQNVTYSQLTKEIQQVAVTACTIATGVQIQTANNPVPFPNVVTSFGITGLSTLTNNGIFTCETAGLYIVSFTSMTATRDAYFRIYKNNEYLLSAFTQNNDYNYHSDTAVIVIHLDASDTISVQPDKDTEVYGSQSRMVECLTIVKVM